MLIGCIALSLSTIANANFTGFSVDLITGFSHNKIKYTGYVDTVSSSHNSAILQVGAGYNFPVYKNILFGMGATYTFNKADAGRIHYSDSSGDYSVSEKMKQHFSVYFTPSYKVTPEISVYGKVAYHHAKAEYNDSYPGEGSNSISMNGFGFGGGVAYAITPNMEIGLEVQQVNFQRKQAALSNSKPSITEYNLIGKYRF